MAVALEAFVKSLEDSGIIAPGKLKPFVPPHGQPKDAQDLARQLVQQKHLTKFQAQEIYLGRAKSLSLGNYTILDKIGAGGMGEVYRAEHRRMHRIVALKMLPKNVTRDAAAVARFQREVEAAARLRHPHIVAADDADEAGGVHFLVLEYVDGSDLSAVVKKNGPLSVAKAVDYILQAAKGLEFAHGEGVVHRDIKPANLLLDKKGVVKILDMGLARVQSPADAATQAELTSSGVIMGTVDYMAPEQARSTKSVDARADIYSLGCSLHYLLAGKPLYAGESITDKLIAHQSDPIPQLRQVRADVPDALEAVFKMMVAKKVEDRYQSMTDLIADLEHCGSNEQSPSGLDSSLGANLDAELLTFLKDIPAHTTHKTHVAKNTVQTKAHRDRKKWGMIGLAAAVLMGVALGAVMSLRTPAGKLTVEVDRPDAFVEVLDPQGKVEIRQPTAAKPIIRPAAPGKPLADFSQAAFQQWKKDVALLPPEEQVTAVVKKLKELNPRFDGRATHAIKNGVVTSFGISSDGVADITPVAALARLKDLKVEAATPSAPHPITDLSPLTGLRLTTLSCGFTQVSDLGPLRGMPLTSLSCEGSQVSDLSPLAGMQLTRLICNNTRLTDLTPLKGMPLATLAVSGTRVADFSVLKDMPLTTLLCSSTSFDDLSLLDGKELTHFSCAASSVFDLSPLVRMPLSSINVSYSPARDAKVLRSIKTLEFINGQPAAAFWTTVDVQQAAFQQWADALGSLSAERQAAAVGEKLRELNPGFDGNATHTMENGLVTGFEFTSNLVADLSPVRALAGLKQLNCSAKVPDAPRLLTDLSPLAGMQLTRLVCTRTQVSDLSPLRGMALTMLNCSHTPVADLSVIKGMPLVDLRVVATRVTDFSPLKGLPLTRLVCDDTSFADLSLLAGMKLTELACKSTQVADLSPLAGMPLRVLDCDIQPARDGATLRALKTLERINGKPVAEFWKQLDAQPAAPHR